MPLADAGYTVTVAAPSKDLTEHLGWRVNMDQPGRHTSFRVRVGASALEWAEAVRNRR